MTFTIDVTCPTCGAPVELVNPGATNGTEAKALVRCENRRHGEWLLTCRLAHSTNYVGTVA